jgi:hypothetical protein
MLLCDFNGSLPPPPHLSIHCKKAYRFFPSPAGMSLTKLSQAGNNLIIPGQGQVGYWLVTSRLGYRKNGNLFLQCIL